MHLKWVEVTATCRHEHTVEQFERTEDLALGRDSLDVGVVLQLEQTAVRILSNLHDLKVAGVVAGWVFTSHNSPVLCIGILQGTGDEVTPCLRREVSVKRYYIFWKKRECVLNIKFQSFVVSSEWLYCSIELQSGTSITCRCCTSKSDWTGLL